MPREALWAEIVTGALQQQLAGSVTPELFVQSVVYVRWPDHAMRDLYLRRHCGAIAFAIGCVLYNLVAGWVGGIEVELSSGAQN